MLSRLASGSVGTALRGTVGRMDGGGGSGWRFAFLAGVLVLTAMIGWYAGRASSLSTRRHAGTREAHEWADRHNDDGENCE